MLLLRPRCINCAATTLEYTMHFDPSYTTLLGVVAYVASAKWVNLIYRGGNMYVDIDDETPTVRSRRRETTRFQVESFPRQSRARSICIRQFENLATWVYNILSCRQIFQVAVLSRLKYLSFLRGNYVTGTSINHEILVFVQKQRTHQLNQIFDQIYSFMIDGSIK